MPPVDAEELALIREMLAAVDGGEVERTRDARLEVLDALELGYTADGEDTALLRVLRLEVESGQLTQRAEGRPNSPSASAPSR